MNDREIHIWVVRLGASDDVLAQCSSWLSDDERQRAERFRFDWLRRDFAASHGVLRWLLGKYLGEQPPRVGFRLGTSGKPALDPASEVNFNLSHSGSLAVYAFAAGCEIGVDVEQIRPVADMEGIAERFFSSAEAAEISYLAKEDRTQGFFNCWTRKEAFIKATGDGMSFPLDAFRVSLKPEEPAYVISIEGDDHSARSWKLESFVPAAGYVGAVAYRGQGRPFILKQPAFVADLLQRNLD